MTMITQPIAVPPPQHRRISTAHPFPSRYWLAGTIAVLGAIAGLALGITSYRDAEGHLDTFARVSVPGTMTVQLDASQDRVVYYEGDGSVRFDDLNIVVTGPAGSAVQVNRYRGEMIYETLDLIQGRAVRHVQSDRCRVLRRRGQRRRERSTCRGRQLLPPSTAWRSHRARPRRTVLRRRRRHWARHFRRPLPGRGWLTFLGSEGRPRSASTPQRLLRAARWRDVIWQGWREPQTSGAPLRRRFSWLFCPRSP